MLHKRPGVTLILVALRSFPRRLVEDQLSDVSKLEGWCVVLCGLSLKAEELPSRRSSLKGSSGKAGRRQSGESNWEVLLEDMRIQCGVENTPCWDGYELRHVWWIMKVIHHTNQKHIWSWIPLKRLKMDLMKAEDQRFCERFFLVWETNFSISWCVAAMSICFVFLPLNNEQDDAISRRTSIEWCDSKGSDWHDSIQEARLSDVGFREVILRWCQVVKCQQHATISTIPWWKTWNETCPSLTSHRLARRKSKPRVAAPLQAVSVIGKTPKRVCVRSTVQSLLLTVVITRPFWQPGYSVQKRLGD